MMSLEQCGSVSPLVPVDGAAVQTATKRPNAWPGARVSSVQVPCCAASARARPGSAAIVAADRVVTRAGSPPVVEPARRLSDAPRPAARAAQIVAGDDVARRPLQPDATAARVPDDVAGDDV